MSIEDPKKPHFSRPHNPDIAHVFFLRGYVERIGSGIRRIVAAFKEQGLPEPVWSVNSGGILTTMMSKKPDLAELNDRQIRFLKSAKAGQKISRKEYWTSFANDVTSRQASVDLKSLVGQGYLVSKGKGRSVSYTRTDKKLA
jgi:ATP-dependent DNA helicase RecG